MVAQGLAERVWTSCAETSCADRAWTKRGAKESSPETWPLGCEFMVGVRRFELLTSSVSGKRSPPELNARIARRDATRKHSMANAPRWQARMRAKRFLRNSRGEKYVLNGGEVRAAILRVVCPRGVPAGSRTSELLGVRELLARWRDLLVGPMLQDATALCRAEGVCSDPVRCAVLCNVGQRDRKYLTRYM